MTLSHHVAVITSDEQALIVASDLAEDFKRDSALRDRERRLPHPELEVFSRSGLWGISVPKEYGGAGVSNVTLAKVIALIAQADGSLGQIPQNHFYALEVLRVNGSDEQKKRLYAEVLAGQRFGNALAELGTKTAHDRVTRLTRDGDGYRINGRKFYATGAIYAQRIPTSVVDENGVQQLAFVPRDSKGLTVIDDWSGFGQRTTGSGSVVFEDVYVAAEDVIPFQSAFERPTTVGPLAQILHAAIDTGIARAAYEDALHFVRTKTRPWIDATPRKSHRRPADHQELRPLEHSPARHRSLAGTRRRIPRQGPGRHQRRDRRRRVDCRRRSPRHQHRNLPRRRQHAVRTGRQPGHPDRTRSGSPLAQRPGAHAARPGALEVSRRRQLLPQR